MTGYWRRIARPIIARVLKETAGQNEKCIRTALREAYPFGPLENWPYHVWRDEVRLQRGLKPPPKLGRKRARETDNATQNLFGSKP